MTPAELVAWLRHLGVGLSLCPRSGAVVVTGRLGALSPDGWKELALRERDIRSALEAERDHDDAVRWAAEVAAARWAGDGGGA